MNQQHKDRGRCKGATWLLPLLFGSWAVVHKPDSSQPQAPTLPGPCRPLPAHLGQSSPKDGTSPQSGAWDGCSQTHCGRQRLLGEALGSWLTEHRSGTRVKEGSLISCQGRRNPGCWTCRAQFWTPGGVQAAAWVASSSSPFVPGSRTHSTIEC